MRGGRGEEGPIPRTDDGRAMAEVVMSAERGYVARNTAVVATRWAEAEDCIASQGGVTRVGSRVGRLRGSGIWGGVTRGRSGLEGA